MTTRVYAVAARRDTTGHARTDTYTPAPARPARRLLTAPEAAEYIGRTRKALYIMVQRGQIPVVRHGRSLRFDLEALDAWIRRNTF